MSGNGRPAVKPKALKGRLGPRSRPILRADDVLLALARRPERETKPCEGCGYEFMRPSGLTHAAWHKRKTCSYFCRDRQRRRKSYGRYLPDIAMSPEVQELALAQAREDHATFMDSELGLRGAEHWLTTGRDSYDDVWEASESWRPA